MSSVNSYNWIELKIGEVAEVVAGGTPKAGNPDNFKAPGTGIAWLTPADLSGYTRKNISFGARDLSLQGYNSSSAKILPKGSLLFSSRAPIGYVAIAQNDISTNQGFKNFVFPYGVDSDYAYYYLRSIRDLAESLGTGTTFKEISGAVAKTLPFLLPPLAEQKVIADKLDTLLAQVETIKARLVRIPENLKTFRQSVLAAAVSGRLNSNDSNYRSLEVKENWAHEVEGRTHWKEHIFSDVIKIIGGSQPPKSEFSTEERDGYIRLIQIRDYKSDAHKVYIPIEKAKRFVSKEDIMIGRYGPPIFQILRGLEGAYNVALMKAEPNAEILDKEYLYWYLQNYKLFNYIDAGSDRTAGQTGVNKKYLESYPILVPPLDEQIEISRRVKELFVFADTIEQKAKVALDSVNNLTQSILAKAFRGELTTDWRAANLDLVSGDNSAEALLEKIKAEREVTPKPKRTAAKKKAGNRMNKKIIKVVEALKEAKKPLNGQGLLAAAGYPKDSSTEQLEQFFLDIRKALNADKSIIKLERSDDGQDWFALAESAASE
ncbi:restriction endonuclease subunit S [Vibrio sp. V01_P9A10T6]|uniref:restriction endonuclease subunit S n=1 Tax=Vibrio sp. V01_P9A10T6 TaxID=2116368 RepID=UPI000D041279|nr:restriction endonuclease subunit S [Vibrio sp. V01_P9A10T6]PRQ61341.1 restriction endonuclease subunit S [Vibrio sp. V01_P9A10T6]